MPVTSTGTLVRVPTADVVIQGTAEFFLERMDGASPLLLVAPAGARRLGVDLEQRRLRASAATHEAGRVDRRKTSVEVERRRRRR